MHPTSANYSAKTEPGQTLRPAWQTGFDASWEIDFWGRIHRQVEAADAQVAASENQRRDTLVSILAEFARDYIELRGIQTQIAIARANLASSNDILQLTKTRAEKGLTTGLDVENAAAQVEAVRATLPALDDQETEHINALSLLFDEPPGSLRGELARAKPIPSTPPRLPLGIPSELARPRPDIRQAEAQLHAATATIGVAVAVFIHASHSMATSSSMPSISKTFGRAARCNMSWGPPSCCRSSKAAASNRPWNCARRSSRRLPSPITRPCFRPGTK